MFKVLYMKNRNLMNEEINKIIKMMGLNEKATTSCSKMMKGVRSSERGPWSLVAIENNKVVGQDIDIKIADLLPAHFEAMRREYPKATIYIEDGTGQNVWSNSVMHESMNENSENWNKN